MSSNVQQQQATEASLRQLEAQGFDVKHLWRDLSERIAAHEGGKPTVDDIRYTLPFVAPVIATHFEGAAPQELHPSALWKGYSYSLSPAQRAILRETYGLTPTKTVTLEWVELWPATQHPRSMCIRSDMHVDPRNRKHVLCRAVIREVGTFFRTAAELDAQDKDKSTAALTESALTVGRNITLESVDRWAIEDLTGVKVGNKVSITFVDAERFHVECPKNRNTAKVSRSEFFKTVAEYATLYKDEPRARKSSVGPTPSLDALIASLNL
jgi:hypothetical protein